MDKRFMANSTSMLVLKLLEKEELYGYQLIKKLEDQSEKVFLLKEGTLYPILHGLEQQGAVESFEQVSDSGRIRRYYRITKKGSSMLKTKAKEWDIYHNAVNRVMGGVLYE